MAEVSPQKRLSSVVVNASPSPLKAFASHCKSLRCVRSRDFLPALLHSRWTIYYKFTYQALFVLED